MVEEKNCASISANGQQHSNNFNQILTNVLRFVKSEDPFKYNEVIVKYVTSTKVIQRRVLRRDEDDKWDNSSPQRNSGKKEDFDTDFMQQFYYYFLG